MTYSEAIQFLYSLRWFGAKFGLENTSKLAELAGNPQHRLRFIHVAGTNGKGSTCAILDSIYRAAGLRVGLFTSPHLVSFGERIQVNRSPVSEPDVVRLVEQARGWIERGWTRPVSGAAPHHPTFFEIVTVMALSYFAEKNCDLVIWETGLGGRLDATNIVTPLLSVITNIQYDHQRWLGETLVKIAAEKAGIIKPGVPVITAAEEPEALHVLKNVAHCQNSPLTVVSPAGIKELALSDVDFPLFPLLGRHQRVNAAVAIAAVRTLTPQICVSEEAIRVGLATVQWAGRLQLVTRPSGQRILLDGAHNMAGAETLAAAIREIFPGLKLTLILGILGDKDFVSICDVLVPLAERIVVVPVASERSATSAELGVACRKANPQTNIVERANLREALADVVRDEVVVLAGSLYLVGEAIELLRLSTETISNERGLNEWVGSEYESAAGSH